LVTLKNEIIKILARIKTC